MNDSIGRICLLIAASEFSGNDVRAFARWLQDRGPERLPQTIEALRRLASGQNTRVDLTQSVPSEITSVDQTDKPVVQRLTKLLFDGTGLSKPEAMRLLFEELMLEDPAISVPAPGKSLNSWLSKLLTIFSGSVLLHNASKIRNRKSHNKKRDWSIGKPIDEDKR